MSESKKTGLARLRDPFADNLIGKLPKPTRQQTDEVKADFKKGFRCPVCAGWHHPKVVHLDYVGHAALTDRFLDADLNWRWEPMSVDASGLPALDKDGLLWIKLTIDGVTRLGVGDAGNKQGGDAMKERIGDALRNAGMRFGAALDLWHIGDLHINDQSESVEQEKNEPKKPAVDPAVVKKFRAVTTMSDLELLWGSHASKHYEQFKDEAKARIARGSQNEY